MSARQRTSPIYRDHYYEAFEIGARRRAARLTAQLVDERHVEAKHDARVAKLEGEIRVLRLHVRALRAEMVASRVAR